MKNDDESGRSSLVFLLLGAFLGVASSVHASLPPSPPLAPVRLVTETYYGTKVADQYRYMENLSDPEVQAWMHAQDDYTRRVIESISGRAKLLARIKLLDESEPAEFSGGRPLAPGEGQRPLLRNSSSPCGGSSDRTGSDPGYAARRFLLIPDLAWSRVARAGAPLFASFFYLRNRYTRAARLARGGGVPPAFIKTQQFRA